MNPTTNVVSVSLEIFKSLDAKKEADDPADLHSQIVENDKYSKIFFLTSRGRGGKWGS